MANMLTWRPPTPKLEGEALRILGRHVSEEKFRFLLVVSILVCLAPMFLGLRLWNDIPDMIITGIINITTGEDDSMPRWGAVFLLPGMILLMDIILHVQFWLFQKKQELPPAQIRLAGRWGAPLVTLLLCGTVTLRSSGHRDLVQSVLLVFVAGLALVILGGHFMDCPRTARFALRFGAAEKREDAWKAIHRFGAYAFSAAGLIVIYSAIVLPGASPLALLALVPIAALLVYALRYN